MTMTMIKFLHTTISCDDDDNKVLAHNNLSCDDNDNEVLTQNNLKSGDNDDEVSFFALLLHRCI